MNFETPKSRENFTAGSLVELTQAETLRDPSKIGTRAFEQVGGKGGKLEACQFQIIDPTPQIHTWHRSNRKITYLRVADKKGDEFLIAEEGLKEIKNLKTSEEVKTKIKQKKAEVSAITSKAKNTLDKNIKTAKAQSRFNEEINRANQYPDPDYINSLLKKTPLGKYVHCLEGGKFKLKKSIQSINAEELAKIAGNQKNFWILKTDISKYGNGIPHGWIRVEAKNWSGKNRVKIYPGETITFRIPTIEELEDGISEERKRFEKLAVRIAKEEGIDPIQFLALVEVESNFQPKEVSGDGAVSLCQLMPETAKDLEVDPHTIEGSLRGGARYLRQQLDRFGNYELAHAAYNAGPGAVEKYDGIPPYKETKNHVRKIEFTRDRLGVRFESILSENDSSKINQAEHQPILDKPNEVSVVVPSEKLFGSIQPGNSAELPLQEKGMNFYLNDGSVAENFLCNKGTSLVTCIGRPHNGFLPVSWKSKKGWIAEKELPPRQVKILAA